VTRQMLIYDHVTPIVTDAHADLCIEPAMGYGFAKTVNSVPLLGVEFVAAAPDHPIVFARNGDAIFPAALLGLRAEVNDHVDFDGSWHGGYLPAFLRRHPFVFSRPEGETEGTYTLCIDEASPRLNRKGRGTPLFEADGSQSETLKNALAFAVEFQNQFHQTQDFCRRLESLNLLEEAQARYRDATGAEGSMGGFSVINREKLKRIPHDRMLHLFRSDELALCYAHLHSLQNILKLGRAAQYDGPVSVTPAGGPASATPADVPVPATPADGPVSITPSPRPETLMRPALHLPAEAALWQGLRALLRHDPLTAGSYKVSAAGVSDRRMLLSFPRADLLSPDDPAPLADLVGGTLPAAMADNWQRTVMLHVGLDGADTGAAVRKLYLEFPPGNAPEADLAYLALKCGGGRQAVHRYERVAEAGALLSTLALPEALVEPAAWLANLSSDLLRVAEPGAARLSLDIGLADLEATSDVLPVVAQLVAAINAEAPAPSEVPSHVAIGRDGNGALFVTLYGWPIKPE
jgi:hypothetical protein